MNPEETLVRVGLALAVGLLIGVERGWRDRGEAEGERTVGLRTFALTGLLDGLRFGLAYLAVSLAALAAGGAVAAMQPWI